MLVFSHALWNVEIFSGKLWKILHGLFCCFLYKCG